MKYTDKLKLQQPENGEFYSVEVFNANSDLIDKAFSGIETDAKDVLEKLKTVDGEGSGLDADLLDGKHSTSFATSDHKHEMSDINNLKLTAENTTIKDTDNNFTSPNVEGALKELANEDKTLQTNIDNNKTEVDKEITNLKQSVSSGKQLIATAVTGKDVPTNGSDSFQTMADNIDILRSNLATTITSKGIESSGVESFDDLNDKVKKIEVEKHTNIPNNIEIHDAILPISELPTFRQKMTVTECNGKIYTIAGENVNDDGVTIAGGSKKIEVYDPKTSTWTTMLDTPKEIISGNATSIDNKIYIHDGKEIFIYDTLTNTWLTSIQRNSNVGLFHAYEPQNRIYLYPRSANNMTYLDLNTNTFTTFTDTQTKLDIYTAYENKAYFLNHGISSGRIINVYLYIYDFDINIWTYKNYSFQHFTDGNIQCSCFYENDKIYMIGGYWLNSNSDSFGNPNNCYIDMESKTLNRLDSIISFADLKTIRVQDTLYFLDGMPLKSHPPSYPASTDYLKRSRKLFCYIP